MAIDIMRFGALIVVGAGLVACGNGGSAVETRDRNQQSGSEYSSNTPTEPQAAYGRQETTVEDEAVSGEKPSVSPAKAAAVLTGNRRETPSDKAVRLFERNGRDFDAATPQDYLDKAEKFARNPPRDVEKIERPNGDVLLYQASTNTFAVVDRRGVLRTMFKPSNGADYWMNQKNSAPSFR